MVWIWMKEEKEKLQVLLCWKLAYCHRTRMWNKVFFWSYSIVSSALVATKLNIFYITEEYKDHRCKFLFLTSQTPIIIRNICLKKNSNTP